MLVKDQHLMFHRLSKIINLPYKQVINSNLRNRIVGNIVKKIMQNWTIVMSHNIFQFLILVSHYQLLLHIANKHHEHICLYQYIIKSNTDKKVYRYDIVIKTFGKFSHYGRYV